MTVRIRKYSYTPFGLLDRVSSLGSLEQIFSFQVKSFLSKLNRLSMDNVQITTEKNHRYDKVSLRANKERKKVRGGRWEEGNGESLFSYVLFPIVPNT